jgi:RNA:NAD 2'-phosphotransferase (TPT1/KptA family)
VTRDLKSHDLSVENTNNVSPGSSALISQSEKPLGKEQTDSKSKPKLPRIAAVFTKRRNPPISTVAKANKIRSWMADTGASVDVVDQQQISKEGQKKVRRLEDSRTYETAAGDVTVNSAISLHSNRVGSIDAIILDGSPAIISVGRKCMIEGYGFYWPPFTPPHIISPGGQRRVDCIVEDYVPYVLEADGVACPFTAAGQPSTSSSSRAPARDESLLQPAMEYTGETEGEESPGHEEHKPEDDEEDDNPDNLTLMQLEARSLHHQLTHLPKNPQCEACQRAKMQHKPHKRRKIPLAERAKAEEFGDLITGDHIVSLDSIDVSIDGKKDAMVIYDVATGYIDCYPTSSRSANEAIGALQHFLGPKQSLGEFYSDAASELRAAAKALGLCRRSATPGIPQTNGLIENKVKKVLQGTRTILDHAGFPSQYWSYACRHFCFSSNHLKRFVNGVEGQEPIRGRKVPEGFSLPKLMPFGCLVEFLPSPIFKRKFPKWSGKSQPGLLLSYNIPPGGIWKGEYIIVMLEDFHTDRKPQIHTVLEAIASKDKDGKFIFPLKEQYEKLRRTPKVPKLSDKGNKEDSEDEEPESKDRTENPFDVPPIISESDNKSTVSKDIISGKSKDKDKEDSGPKQGGDIQDAGESTATSSNPKKSSRPLVGYDESYGFKTRRKSDSERPWDVPGESWKLMKRPEKDEAIANFKRTGYGWPKESKGTIAPIINDMTESNDDIVDYPVPAMPTICNVKSSTKHREKIPDVEARFMSICVARSVSKKEADATPEAAKAMNKEWEKLETQKAWLVETVREWRDVAAEAKAKNEVVHVGRVFGILVEKGSELPKGHPDRKFKGRVVFQGNNVKDQTGDWALFEELSSAPATMEAGKAVDAYGCVEGHVCQQADGTSAYTQAFLGGTKTWIRIPPERWPNSWKNKFHDPVVVLSLALYGHPDAGGYWEKHCDSHILSEGFISVPDWRSIYWHKDLKVLLIVYVDDFKMSGPKESVAKAWQKLRKGLIIEDPSPAGKFLGCTNVLMTQSVPEPFNCLSLAGEGGPEHMPTGKTVKVNVVKYDQKDFLQQCVTRYLELAGPNSPPLIKADTPFIDTTSKVAIDQDDHETHRGLLAPIASKVLMKVLYAARVGRFDLLRPICWLATKVTKWSKTCDIALHKLISYINCSLDVANYGWIGDKWEDLKLIIYADANWAEKPTYTSTSGAFMCLSGKNSFFPLAAMSKKQTAKSHSTPEAEIVAADMAIRLIGLPSLQLWDCILGQGVRKLVAIFKEDNEAAIRVMSTGKNPTMRHMQRTHGLDLAWLCERFSRKEFTLEYCPTRSMCADIFTKGFTERSKWIAARKLIAHYTAQELGFRVASAKVPITTIAVRKQGGDRNITYDRIIIEYCCSPESKIGEHTRWSNKCLVYRITEQDDATKDSTISKIKDIIHNSLVPVLLFASMPCTGGSPWQNINAKKPGGQRRILNHKTLFNKLWNNFEVLCGEIHDRGHHIAIEWPRACSYWRLPKVVALKHRYDLLDAHFDGCMFGLMSVAYPELSIKKPWTISTSCRRIHAVFNDRLCDNSHKHTPCAGRDTKMTEQYTNDIVMKLHDTWRRFANRNKKYTGQHVVRIIHTCPLPKISFVIRQPNVACDLKQLSNSSSTSATKAKTLPYYTPRVIMASASATSSVVANAKGAGKGNVGKPDEIKTFDDIKLAFSMSMEDRPGWEAYFDKLLVLALLVGELEDNLPDVRGFNVANAKHLLPTNAGKTLRIIGSPMTDVLTSRVINATPPSMDEPLKPVCIFGDSGLLQYIQDPNVGRPKMHDTYVKEALKKVFNEQALLNDGIQFLPHHGADLKYFTKCAVNASKDPDRVYIAALFLNDFIGAKGGVRWDPVANALKPGSPLQTFFETFKTLPHKALIVGGSSKVWGVGDDYDDVVEMVVANARAHGIPTVRGTRCWLRMPLVRESKQGKIMTWHVQASDVSAEILAYFLKSVYSLAIQFNPPNATWLEDVKRFSAIRHGDPVSTVAVGKPLVWGVNPVELPKPTPVEVTKVSVTPSPTSEPSPHEQPSESPHDVPAEAPQPSSSSVEGPPPEADIEHDVAKAETGAIIVGDKTTKFRYASDNPRDWSNCMVLAEDVEARYSENFNIMTVNRYDAKSFSKTMSWLLRHKYAEVGKPGSVINGTAGWYPVTEVVKDVKRSYPRKEFNVKKMLYVVARAASGRFELYITGPDVLRNDTRTTTYIRTAAGQSRVCGPEGEEIQDPEAVYHEDQELRADQLPTGYAYHGTHSSLWEKIVSTVCKAGGEGRTNRMMNHLSPFPAGDHRNLGASKDNSHVSIEYDILAFQRDLKESGETRKIYFPTNKCIVTAVDIPGPQYARRTIDTRTKMILWVNPVFFPTAAKARAGRPMQPTHYQRPPREMLMHGSARDLEEWNSQFAEHLNAEADKIDALMKQTGTTVRAYRPSMPSSSSSSSRPNVPETKGPPPMRTIAEADEEKSDEEESISRRFKSANKIKAIDPSAKRKSEAVSGGETLAPWKRKVELMTEEKKEKEEKEEEEYKPGSLISSLLIEEKSSAAPKTPSEIASEIGSELAKEDMIEMVMCPNLLCGETHIPGTLVCSKCQEILDDEPSLQWDPNDPIISGQSITYSLGENAVIDDLAHNNHPSVQWLNNTEIVANAHAIAKARSINNQRDANAASAKHRIDIVTQKRPVVDQWHWSYKLKTWVDRDARQQEDYNRSASSARNWCEKNLAPWKLKDKWGNPIRDHLWLRLVNDDEFLTQMVLRNEISLEPELQHPDVRDKAWEAARWLGVLNQILATYAVARAPAAQGLDPEQCQAGDRGESLNILLLVFTLILGMTIAWIFNFIKSKWRRPTRTMSTQSQTTYTGVRGVANARFLPLPENSHGATQE